MAASIENRASSLMSWNPLRKLSKGGGGSDDRDVTRSVKDLERLEAVTRRLHKDSKKYEECVLELSKSECKMTEDLSSSALCRDEERLRMLVEEWHSFCKGCKDTDDELVSNVHQLMTLPCKQLQAVFPEVRLALRKLEQATNDTAKFRLKVNRLQGKEATAANLVKMDQAKHACVVSSNAECNARDVLKRELPTLYERRVEYFQPCLEGVIRSEVNHWGETTRIFNHLLVDIPKHNGQLDARMKARMDKMQSLSIVTAGGAAA